MSKIQELEKQLAEARAAEANAGIEEWTEQVKTVIGKYYKRVVCLGYGDKVNTNYLHYVKILGLSDKPKIKKEASLVIYPMNLAITPVGWTRKEGKLSYKNTVNKFQTTKVTKRDYTKQIENGKLYEYARTNIYSIEDGCIQLGYSRGDSWKECTQEEFEDVERLSNQLCKEFYDKLIPYCVTKNNYKPFTLETEQMIPNIDEAALKRIDDLISSKTDINLLINTLAGKVARYNYFNGTILPELAQYHISGNGGMLLNIYGGDDGTDYEPYVTRYYIGRVNIDWPHILYPIRTKLSCGVHELAEKLSDIKEVYNPSSWLCSYNSRGYDAVFEHAKLLPGPLAKVNAVINANIK